MASTFTGRPAGAGGFPTPLDVHVGLQKGHTWDVRRCPLYRTTVSLEEVLYSKLKAEQSKLRSSDGSKPRSAEELLRPRSRRTNSPQKSSFFVDEIVPREVDKVDRNRRFHKRVSNFQEEIELPSLGISMKMDCVSQCFNFGSRPLSRSQNLSKQDQPQSPSLSVLSSTRELPSGPASQEQYLKFLMDTFVEPATAPVATGTGAEAEVSPAAEEQPSNDLAGPPAAATVAEAEAAREESHHASSVAQSQVEGKQKAVKGPGKAPLSALPGASLCIGMGAGAKRRHLAALLARQQTADEQLQLLLFRQRQVEDLQRQVIALQQEQQGAEGTASASSPTQEELQARLRSLMEQQAQLQLTHQQLVASCESQWLQQRLTRQQVVRKVQERAKLELLQRQGEHAEAEAAAMLRQQQRQQRHNALLWNRNRYEVRRKEQPSSSLMAVNSQHLPQTPASPVRLLHGPDSSEDATPDT